MAGVKNLPVYRTTCHTGPLRSRKSHQGLLVCPWHRLSWMVAGPRDLPSGYHTHYTNRHYGILILKVSKQYPYLLFDAPFKPQVMSKSALGKLLCNGIDLILPFSCRIIYEVCRVFREREELLAVSGAALSAHSSIKRHRSCDTGTHTSSPYRN